MVLPCVCPDLLDLQLLGSGGVAMASAEETPSFSSDAEEAKYEIVHLSLVASEPEILRSCS